MCLFQMTKRICVFSFNSEFFSGSKNMFFAEPEYVPVSDDNLRESCIFLLSS